MDGRSILSFIFSWYVFARVGVYILGDIGQETSQILRHLQACLSSKRIKMSLSKTCDLRVVDCP